MSVADKSARGLPPSTQEDLRRRTVAAVESGHTQTEVAEIFNVSVRSVNRWVNLARRKGSAALAARQRPEKRSYQRDPVKVAHWLDHEYPAILAAAKAQGGIVLWLDESGVCSNIVGATGYAAVGRAPLIQVNGRRFRVNLMAAINNRGLMRFMVYDGSPTVSRYTTFLDRLITDLAPEKVFLIVDRHPTHRAKTVTAWLAARADRIEQHHLPGYAPDLNPVELLNADTKRVLTANATPRDRASLRAELRTHLHSVQKRCERVKSFFHKEPVRYAAA